jgi:hypothetical protein
MKTFKTADMQRQGKVILDTAKDEGQIRIVRGKDIFVLTYEPGEEPDGSEVIETTRDIAPGILEEMLQVQKDILAELRSGQMVMTEQVVTEDTCSEPEDLPEPAKVVIPAQEPRSPEFIPREPTDLDKAYALDFYGLRRDPATGQPELTPKGRENGELSLKKMVRQGHDEALRIWEMPEDAAERYLFLLAVQLDKYEKAIEKCQTGNPDWIAGAPR